VFLFKSRSEPLQESEREFTVLGQNMTVISCCFGPGCVRTVLLETGLEAKYLELELTEGILMQNGNSVISLLQDLKVMGVQLAVDDFGTGYSSLSYLRQFPIDVLKIDQSFIQQITANTDDSAIVSAIISMGKSLKHLVIAEGIERKNRWHTFRPAVARKGKATSSAGPWPPPHSPIYYRKA
jgi:EAL domain-containing protein (putative c-di-GMP-specific phosphodiesterase class I)